MTILRTQCRIQLQDEAKYLRCVLQEHNWNLIISWERWAHPNRAMTCSASGIPNNKNMSGGWRRRVSVLRACRAYAILSKEGRVTFDDRSTLLMKGICLTTKNQQFERLRGFKLTVALKYTGHSNANPPVLFGTWKMRSFRSRVFHAVFINRWGHSSACHSWRYVDCPWTCALTHHSEATLQCWILYDGAQHQR